MNAVKTQTAETRKEITRYGVEWSNDGERWLAIVNDKTLEEAQAHFRANTANHKRLVRHNIIKTVLNQ